MKFSKRIVIPLFAVLLSLLYVASAALSQQSIGSKGSLPVPHNPAEGFRLFYKKGCMECHAIGGYGGTAAQDLARIVSKKNFYGIAQMIWNHVPKMSEKYEEEKIQWPRISAEEMSHLMPFLYFLNFLDKEGDPEEGEKALFREKCVTCHRVGKVGIVKVKSLDEFKAYKSPVFFVTRFWNSGKELGEFMRAQGLRPFEFRENDLVNMIAYIKRSALEEIEEKEFYLPPPNPRNGERLFSEKGCVKCHPRPGTPREAFGGAIIGSFTQIAGRMLNHTMWSGPNRPEIPLTPEEMSDLVSYIYFLSYPGKPGNPGVGERLFVEKKCMDCHALNGRGGTAASDLGSTSNLKTPIELLDGMWNSAPEKMKEEMVEAGVVWPEFRGEELADLFAYILSQTK